MKMPDTEKKKKLLSYSESPGLIDKLDENL